MVKLGVMWNDWDTDVILEALTASSKITLGFFVIIIKQNLTGHVPIILKERIVDVLYTD